MAGGDGTSPANNTRGLLFSLTRHHGTVDLKTARLRDNFMEAEGFIQHFRVRQKRVGDDSQFTPLFR